MRIVLLIVAWCGLAVAAPKAGPKAPKTPPAQTPEQKLQQELIPLDKQMYELQGKAAYFAAVKIARKTYEMQRKAAGEDAAETQRRKQTLASMLNLAGDYSEALKLYKELLATAEKVHGPESREVLWALAPLTGPYWQQNRLDELDPIYQRMITLTKKVEGEQSQQYAMQLMQYGTLLNSRNEYSSAQRMYEQSLKVYEAITAGKKNDTSLLSPLQILANVYWQSNQRPKAIALYDRALAIAQADGNVMTLAGTMWGIAAVYHYGGRDDLAAPLTKKVVEIYSKEIAKLEKDKPDDGMIPIYYGQLGYVHRQAGDLAAAEKALVKSIEIDDKKGRFSSWLPSLADLKRAQGKPKEALALLEKSQAGLAKIAPGNATAYNTMIADVLRELGEYKRAEALLLEYTTHLQKQYGRRHPLYGMAELSTAYVYMGAGKIGEAERLLTDSLEIAERDLSNNLKTGTEADHAVYFSRNNYQLDTAINFHLTYAPKSASVARLALTTLLRRKGRVLDAAAASLATIRAKLSPDDKKLLDDLASARAKLAKLTVAGPSATGDADYTKEVAALEDQISKLELAVGKKSAAYRVVSASIELKTIQKAIPKDARLVEVVNFQPSDPKAAFAIFNPKALPPRHYAAYVIGATGDPSVVDLGEVGPIDEAVAKFRKAVADPDNDRAAELGHALYTLTFGKVKPALGSSTNVLMAPDGTLNVIPFSALVDDKQQFLIKTYTFTYLTSGRDLLRVGLRTKAQGGGVIFADPSFDSSGKPAAAGGGTRGRRSADLTTLSWPPLPGTGQEADLVEKTMRGLKVYRGADATEGAVKQLHGPKILHLATHGFFLTDEAPPVKDDDAGAPRAAPPAAPALGAAAPMPAGNYENPLLRSGLAFAGANKLSSGDDDGILTAMEASGLDLWGTKLVVLSACETGVGKVTNGEGVYGLRRALVIAGAESLVMTLWQVDDIATRDLMGGYYKRLEAGKPRSSALRDVQLEIAARPKYTHPYYWASFVPAGDNTPLKD